MSNLEKKGNANQNLKPHPTAKPTQTQPLQEPRAIQQPSVLVSREGHHGVGCWDGPGSGTR